MAKKDLVGSTTLKVKSLSIAVSRDGKMVKDLCVDDAQGVHINAILALAKVNDVISITVVEREAPQYPLMQAPFSGNV